MYEVSKIIFILPHTSILKLFLPLPFLSFLSLLFPENVCGIFLNLILKGQVVFRTKASYENFGVASGDDYDSGTSIEEDTTRSSFIVCLTVKTFSKANSFKDIEEGNLSLTEPGLKGIW